MNKDDIKKGKYTWIVISVAFAAFMSKLDSYVVNISLPTISRHFSVDTGTVSLTVIVYFLVGSSTLLFFGKLGDRIGLRKVFLSGYWLFTIGSLLCGISWNIYALIVFRFIQGIGGAMLMAAGYAMIPRYVPAEINGWAFGLLTTGAAAGVVVGAPVGGFITEYLSWHWIFLINIPVGVAAISIASKVLMPDKNSRQDKDGFDLLGTLLSLFGLAALLYALTMGDRWGWTSRNTLMLFCASFFLLGSFFLWEKFYRAPLIDFRLLKNSRFIIPVTAAFFAFMLMGGNTFLMPFYLEVGKGITTFETGLLLLVHSIVYIVVGPVMGRLSDTIRSSILCVLAMAFASIGSFSFALGLDQAGLMIVSAFLAWLGLSFGMFMSPNNNQVMKAVPFENQGIASGLFTTISTLGLALGVSLFESLFSTTIHVSGPALDASSIRNQIPFDSVFKGFRNAYMLGGAMGIAALFFSFLVLLVTDRKKGK